MENLLYDANQISIRMSDRKMRLMSICSRYEVLSKKHSQAVELSTDVENLELTASKKPAHSAQLLSLIREKSAISKLEDRNSQLKKLVSEYESSASSIIQKYRSHVSQLIEENNQLLKQVDNLSSKVNQLKNEDNVHHVYPNETMDSPNLEAMYISKIEQLLGVMKQAADAEDDSCFYYKKVFSQLKFENNNLKCLLMDEKYIDKKLSPIILQPIKTCLKNKSFIRKKSFNKTFVKRRISGINKLAKMNTTKEFVFKSHREVSDSPGEKNVHIVQSNIFNYNHEPRRESRDNVIEYIDSFSSGEKNKENTLIMKDSAKGSDNLFNLIGNFMPIGKGEQNSYESILNNMKQGIKNLCLPSNKDKIDSPSKISDFDKSDKSDEID